VPFWTQPLLRQDFGVVVGATSGFVGVLSEKVERLAATTSAATPPSEANAITVTVKIRPCWRTTIHA
jgi:hypothetical protein